MKNFTFSFFEEIFLELTILAVIFALLQLILLKFASDFTAYSQRKSPKKNIKYKKTSLFDLYFTENNNTKSNNKLTKANKISTL